MIKDIKQNFLSVEKQNYSLHKIRRKSQISFSLIRLINSQFLKNKNELFFTFIFSVVFVAMFGHINAAQFNYGATYFMSVLSGIFMLQVIQCGMQSMPTAIMEFKTSVLLKRIGATPIKPWMFILSTAIYYFIVTVIQIFWLILWVIIAFSFTQFKMQDSIDPSVIIGTISGWDLMFGINSTVNWGGYIFSLFYASILSIFIGLFISSVSKTSQSAQIIGMMFFFVNMFLAGLLLPIGAINSILPLRIISYFTPYRYVSGLSSTAWATDNGNIFNPNYLQTIAKNEMKFEVYDNWLNLFIPLVFISLAIFVSIKFFKWNNR